MANQYGPRIITDGLICCFDASNNKSYSGSGNSIYNLANNSLNGTMSSVTFSSSNNGVLVLDASSDYIVINHDSLLNFDSSFTLSVWIKINTLNLSSIYNIVSKKASFNGTQKGWSCQLDYRNTGIMHFRNNDGTVTNDSTQDSTVNNTALLNQTSSYKNLVWVVRKSPQHVWFYIDGILRSGPHAITYTNTDTSNNLYIGKTLGSSGDGAPPINLGNVLLYNTVLNANNILTNYNALKGRFSL